jgi:hypothetical protein
MISSNKISPKILNVADFNVIINLSGILIALQRCYVLNKKATFFQKDKSGFFDAANILGGFEVLKGPLSINAVFRLF